VRGASPTPVTHVSRLSATLQIGELSRQGLQGCFEHALNTRIAWLMQPVGLHAAHFFDALMQVWRMNGHIA
jgi:hypothetical protein